MQYYCANILAKRLKKLRGDRTQKEFARFLRIPPSTLNRLEQGVLNTKLETLDRICMALNCTPAELFSNKKLKA